MTSKDKLCKMLNSLENVDLFEGILIDSTLDDTYIGIKKENNGYNVVYGIENESKNEINYDKCPTISQILLLSVKNNMNIEKCYINFGKRISSEEFNNYTFTENWDDGFGNEPCVMSL